MNKQHSVCHPMRLLAIAALVFSTIFFGPVAANLQTAHAGIQKKLLRLHNKHRQKRNLPRLKRHSALNRAAGKYATVMARNNHFGHTGPSSDPSTFDGRIRAAGFRRSPIGENIAYGQRTAGQVVRAWMRSSGHRRNILNRKYRFAGFGKASRANGPYWVTDFGG